MLSLFPRRRASRRIERRIGLQWGESGPVLELERRSLTVPLILLDPGPQPGVSATANGATNSGAVSASKSATVSSNGWSISGSGSTELTNPAPSGSGGASFTGSLQHSMTSANTEPGQLSLDVSVRGGANWDLFDNGSPPKAHPTITEDFSVAYGPPKSATDLNVNVTITSPSGALTFRGSGNGGGQGNFMPSSSGGGEGGSGNTVMINVVSNTPYSYEVRVTTVLANPLPPSPGTPWDVTWSADLDATNVGLVGSDQDLLSFNYSVNVS